jgi:hypothetical protein
MHAQGLMKSHYRPPGAAVVQQKIGAKRRKLKTPFRYIMGVESQEVRRLEFETWTLPN